MTGIVLAMWEAEPDKDLDVLVAPDGCRDLIVWLRAGKRPQWFVSALDDCAYLAPVEGGAFVQGFRLKPGVRVNETALLDALQGREPDFDYALGRLHDHCARRGPVSEALDALASGVKSVSEAAASLGVSSRTVQRLLIAETGRSPSFWLQLARVRKAARAVLTATSLAEVAYSYGYADQAHMTREVRRWFGRSPRALQRNPAFASVLHESGYT